MTCEKRIANPSLANRKLCRQSAVCVARDKNLIRVQVHKFVEKGLVEKSKVVTGRYRRIDSKLEPLDIANAEPGLYLDVKYPFGLERVLKTQQKELVVIAGATGAGKSAYLFNFCLDNLERHEVNLFANSEQTASSIKKRLLDHPKIGSFNMSNLKGWDRSDNFADVIFPDGINVIDYLEISSERPQKVSDDLSAIHSKLKTGMAIVAIQKRTNQKIKGKVYETEIGYGGDWSKFKSGIYLTIDHVPENKLVIRKCRDRVMPEINPIGMEWKFKLVNGIAFCQVQEPDDLIGMKPQEPIEITGDEPF